MYADDYKSAYLNQKKNTSIKNEKQTRLIIQKNDQNND